MIEYIHGELAEITPTYAVIEAAGVGYMINISLNTYSQLSQTDNNPKDTKLLVHEIIREDTHTLYGFLTSAEREMFLLLISVAGIGPNIARVLLSEMTIGELYDAITTGEVRALRAAKGVGSRMAQRIIVELKDKVIVSESLRKAFEDSNPATDNNAGKPATLDDRQTTIKDEAVGALTMLGFSPAPSAKVVTAILREQPELAVEQVIKLALKNIK